MSKINDCPFDFMQNPREWAAYHWHIYASGLTEEQAATNVRFEMSGWKLVKGFKYGAWSYPIYREILEGRYCR